MPMRRRYPFSYLVRDFDELMNEMESRFQEVADSGTRFLQPGGFPDRLLPAIRGEFRVDVREHEDEVLVVADLPGVEKEDVRISLVNPRTLGISIERKAAGEEKDERYFLRERVYGSMSRTVSLPHEVSDQGSTASFTNGVLEVRLKRLPGESGARIPIE